MTLVSKYLIYLGTLPFIFFSIIIAYKINEMPNYSNLDFETIISVYTIAIISFISGSHWAQSSKVNNLLTTLILISSNIIVVLIWFAYLFLIFEVFIFISSIILVILLYIEKILLSEVLCSKTYYHHRVFATSIVLISFCLMLYNRISF